MRASSGLRETTWIRGLGNRFAVLIQETLLPNDWGATESVAPTFRRSARLWLLTAALVGLGQQAFVVLRNPLLAELGFTPESIAAVQGAGGAAGVVAGVVGLWSLRRFAARTTLLVAVMANAAGFILQVRAHSLLVFVLGAALAGLGIQAITMGAAPLLARHSAPDERARLFLSNAVAVQTLPGVVGAIAAGMAQRAGGSAFGSAIIGYRFALGGAAAAVIVGLAPLALLRDVAPSATTGLLRLREPRWAAALLVPDALFVFGNGLTVPFLQLYFKQRFGLASDEIGWLYGAMMLVGTVGLFAAPALAKWSSPTRVLLGAQALMLPLFAELLFARAVIFAAAAFIVRQALAMVIAPLYTSVLHSRVADADSGPVASYRMIVQSVVWAGANFIAATLFSLDAGGFRGVIAATIVAYVAALASSALVLTRLR